MRHWLSVRADGSIINIQKYEYGSQHPTLGGHGGFPACNPNDMGDTSPEALQIRLVRDTLNAEGAGITRLVELDCSCPPSGGLCNCPDEVIYTHYYDGSNALQARQVSVVTVSGVPLAYTGNRYQQVEIVRAPGTPVEIVVEGIPAGDKIDAINSGAMLINPRRQTISEGIGLDAGKWKITLTAPAQGLSGGVLLETNRALCRGIRLVGFA